jgi:CheY-like chemotaxis protein
MSRTTSARASRTDPSRSFRVLVVDDNEADRRLTMLHLDQAWPFTRDLEFDWAADGTEALQKLRASRFALVILDWRLPSGSGAAVLQTMRGHHFKIPVVVVSGLVRADIPEDLDAWGAAFVNKQEMNASTFHAAIARSLKLMGHEAPPQLANDPG